MKVEFHDRSITVGKQWFPVKHPIGGLLGLKQVFGYDDLSTLTERHFFLLLFLVDRHLGSKTQNRGGGGGIQVKDILKARLPGWNCRTVETFRKAGYKAFAGSSCVEVRLGCLSFNPPANVQFSIHLPDNQSVKDYLRSQRSGSVALGVQPTVGLVIHRALRADGLDTTWYRPACGVPVKNGVVILTTNATRVNCADCIALPQLVKTPLKHQTREDLTKGAEGASVEAHSNKEGVIMDRSTWISGLFVWSLTDGQTGRLMEQILCVPLDGTDEWTARMQGIAKLELTIAGQQGQPYYSTFVQTGPGRTGSGNVVSMRRADIADLADLVRLWHSDNTLADWASEVSGMKHVPDAVKESVANAVRGSQTTS